MKRRSQGVSIFYIILALTTLGGLVFMIPAPRLFLLLIGVTAILSVNLIFFNLYGTKWLVILLLFSCLLSRYEITIAQFSIRIEHLSAAMIAPSIILSLLLNGIRPFRVTRSMMLLAIWLLLNLVASYLFAPEPFDSYIHISRLFLLVAIYVSITNFSSSKVEAWWFILRTWLLFGILEAAYGIFAWILAITTSVNIGVQISSTVPVPAIYGTLLEGNLFGSFISSIFLVLLSFFIWQRKSWVPNILPKRFLIPSLFITGIAITLSYARAAWISTGVGVIIVLSWSTSLRHNRLSRFAFFATILGLTGMAILALLVILPIELSLLSRLRTFVNLSSDPTWQLRLSDATLAIQDWFNHPILGNGTGSFAQLHGIRLGSLAWISNIVLHTLVDTGILGLGILSLLLIGLIVESLRMSHKSESLPHKIGLQALSLSMVTLLISYQMTSGTWFATFWIHLALISGGLQLAPKTPVTDLGGTP